MKLSIRLATVAVTAVALAGVLGAQGRSRGGHASGGRASGGAQMHSSPRMAVSRGQSQGFARQNVHVQRYAGRNDFAARGGFAGRANIATRGDVRGRSDVGARGAFRGNTDVRGRIDVRGRPVAVAEHGRPLITRGGFVTPRGYERGAFRDARFGAGFNRWGGRMVLPIGWGSRVVFGGFFPAAYAGYCEAVPYDYDYLLPPMAPSYDPCLFGDRIVVYDRFSRSIVFVAAL